MKFLRIPSLRWRLVMVMCVAYVIVAFVSGAVGFSAQNDSLHKQLNSRAKSNATILAAGAVAPLNRGHGSDIVTLQIFVRSIRSAPGVSYADIRGPDGCPVAQTKRVAYGPKECDLFPGVTKPMVQSLGDGSVMGVAPIAPGGGAITLLGHAVVIISNASIQSDLNNALLQDILVRVLGFVLFFFLSLFIAQYVLGPLSNLSRAALAIRSGRMDSRVPVIGETELAAVSEAFNTMADALEQRIKHLSFLAHSGAQLPNTLRQREKVEPLLAEFGAALGASAAGLVETENEMLWCSTDAERCRSAIEQIGALTDPGVEEHDGLTIMAVPVPGDALFVAVREANEPFSEEEQQVIANFAYQMGIAADNVRLFEAQQEALQVKDQFLSIVSHELRTPLTTMKGYAQMLRRKLVDDPEGQRFASSIDAQVSRLSRLVDDLLDVTRFARGQFELARRKVDLRPILEETVNRFRVISQRHDLALEIDAGSYVGHWDRDRLEQVLNNLVSNAIKYSPQGGTVTVGAHHDDGRIVVFVRDEGVGIPEEDQQHLFERFYRGVNEMHDVKGLGLGLYVTQRVVDAHGGEVRVRSKEGEGSEFSFTLPVTEAPQPALTSPSTESA